MSTYYEARGVNFDKVVKDIRDGKIQSITVDPSSHENDVCITDGTNFLHLLPPCMAENAVGLKRWGGNNISPMLETLEAYYHINFVDEEDLGVLHLG